MISVAGKIIRGLSVLALGVGLSGAPSVVSAETLSDALVSAYKNSGLLEQQRALLRAEDEDVAIAVSALRPVLSYSASLNRTLSSVAPFNASTSSVTAAAALSLDLLVFDFGATEKEVEIARENVLMARDTLIGVEQNVMLNAINAYLDMIAAQQNISLTGNSVRLINEELRAARDRFEVGEITQTDVSTAEAALAAARTTEVSAQGSLLVARESYKAAVGHYPSNIAALPTPPRIPSTVEEAKAQARSRHPDILSAQKAVSVAEMGVEISKLSALPTVSVGGTLSRNYTTSTSVDAVSAQAGISVSGPIYAGGQIAALHRKAVAQSEAARAALLVTTQNVERAVGNAWAQLAIARASIQSTGQQIRAATVALRGAREEATLGARTTLDVLDAEQELLDAQVAQVQAQVDQYSAVYTLLSTMGLLTADHLKLGIATYDPSAYYNAVQDAPLRVVSPQGEKLDHILEALGKR